ncbi:MAG: hypothetical protein KatS3mg082_1314 [Nitrospiraceae bacterium]|nr:MAG: hypothetical protein KatS3mg082_1314 [Nitrospiraceae bacterium]
MIESRQPMRSLCRLSVGLLALLAVLGIHPPAGIVDDLAAQETAAAARSARDRSSVPSWEWRWESSAA